MDLKNLLMIARHYGFAEEMPYQDTTVEDVENFLTVCYDNGGKYVVEKYREMLENSSFTSEELYDLRYEAYLDMVREFENS